MEEANRLFGDRTDLILCESAEDAASGADALAVVTEWKAFRSPDFHQLKILLKEPVIFDGRNIYDPQALQDLGIHYFGIGRGNSVHTDHSDMPAFVGS
jgi:UDPglucose 6-dehydrogenase